MAFTFGENWLAFSEVLDDARVGDAVTSLQKLFGASRLDGLSVVDVGAGSGLFSVAALRLGAARVTALDRDANCVVAITRNAARFLDAQDVARLDVRTADVLDPASLPAERFDIVYAWGSLHHTGAMWEAIENASRLCREGGTLVLAIYNETWFSGGWLALKRAYHRAPAPVRVGMVGLFAGARSIVRVLTGKSRNRSERGMSVWFDAVDWLGGLPYECTTPDALRVFLQDRGFTLERCWTTRRHGCNEFAFKYAPATPSEGSRR